MIASAKNKVQDPKITFEIADATKLPYKDKSFGAIFIFGAIHHIPGRNGKRSFNRNI